MSFKDIFRDSENVNKYLDCDQIKMQFIMSKTCLGDLWGESSKNGSLTFLITKTF